MADANSQISNVTHTQETRDDRFRRRVLTLLNTSAKELSILNSAIGGNAFDPNGMPPSPLTANVPAALTCRP